MVVKVYCVCQISSFESTAWRGAAWANAFLMELELIFSSSTPCSYYLLTFSGSGMTDRPMDLHGAGHPTTPFL